MSQQTLTAHRVRIKLDQTRRESVRDVFTGMTPYYPKNFSLRVEVGIYEDAVIKNISNLASATLKVKALDDKTGDSLMEDTISGGDINASMTDAQWLNGTAQHLIFTFTAEETNFALQSETTLLETLWCVIYGTTNDDPALKVMLGAFEIRREELGDAGSEPPAPAPPDAYSKTETDALVAGCLRQSNPSGAYVILDKVIYRDVSTGDLYQSYYEDGTKHDEPIAI